MLLLHCIARKMRTMAPIVSPLIRRAAKSSSETGMDRGVREIAKIAASRHRACVMCCPSIGEVRREESFGTPSFPPALAAPFRIPTAVAVEVSREMRKLDREWIGWSYLSMARDISITPFLGPTPFSFPPDLATQNVSPSSGRDRDFTMFQSFAYSRATRHIVFHQCDDFQRR